MGQQPNIELEIADLPRPVPAPAPARRWSPRRPGELNSPEEVPWGGMFGTPGPDTGYVLRLLADEELSLGRGEGRSDVVAALAALASARASLYGRAPTHGDIAVAKALLGLDPTGVPAEVIDELAEQRPEWVANLAHDSKKAYQLVGAVDPAMLRSSVEAVLSEMAQGTRLVAL